MIAFEAFLVGVAIAFSSTGFFLRRMRVELNGVIRERDAAEALLAPQRELGMRLDAELRALKLELDGYKRVPAPEQRAS